MIGGKKREPQSPGNFRNSLQQICHIHKRTHSLATELDSIVIKSDCVNSSRICEKACEVIYTKKEDWRVEIEIENWKRNERFGFKMRILAQYFTKFIRICLIYW